MSKYWMVTKEDGTPRLFYLRSEAEEYLIEVLKTSETAHRKYSLYVEDQIADGHDTEGFFDYLSLIVSMNKNETAYMLCWNEVREIPVCMSVEAALNEDKAELEADEIKDMGE